MLQNGSENVLKAFVKMGKLLLVTRIDTHTTLGGVANRRRSWPNDLRFASGFVLTRGSLPKLTRKRAYRSPRVAPENGARQCGMDVLAGRALESVS